MSDSIDWVVTKARSVMGEIKRPGDRVTLPSDFFGDNPEPYGLERADTYVPPREVNPRDVSAWQGTRDPQAHQVSLFERARRAVVGRKDPIDLDDV